MTRRAKNVCPSSYRRIMRLKYKDGADALSFWTENASSSVKTANEYMKGHIFELQRKI